MLYTCYKIFTKISFFLCNRLNYFSLILARQLFGKKFQLTINCLLMRNYQSALARFAKGALFLTSFLFISFSLLAQTPVKGRLTDGKGAPLVGASVIIK